jgi:hypothetical protein
MRRFSGSIVFAVIILAIINRSAAQNSNTLSTKPTVSQLNGLFFKMASGEADPFVIIPQIAAKGDNVLQALQSILFVKPQDLDESTYRKYSNYAVVILESMGTTKACSLLVRIATEHPVVDARGRALNSLANVYYQYAQTQRILPDTSIIKLFVYSADDTTCVDFLQSRIGQIARDGLKNWTGEEWGSVQLDEQRSDTSGGLIRSGTVPVKRQTKAQSMTAHRQWWQDNRGLLRWSAAKTRFEKK